MEWSGMEWDGMGWNGMSSFSISKLVGCVVGRRLWEEKRRFS